MTIVNVLAALAVISGIRLIAEVLFMRHSVQTDRTLNALALSRDERDRRQEADLRADRERWKTWGETAPPKIQYKRAPNDKEQTDDRG